jgi:radical SAM protein with 4Fe4S-binding SPASM domain
VPIADDSIIHLSKDGNHIYFNPVTGGYIVTDGPGSGLIGSIQATDDEDLVIARLAEELGLDEYTAAARYVAFSERLRQRGMLEKPVQIETAIPSPFYGFIEVTRKCPSICRICAIDTGRGSENLLTLDEIKLVVDQFREIGVKFVALTGGDPLMRPDLLEMLEYVRACGLACGFSTSLLTLTDAMARELARLEIKVQVSIDGSRPETNDYNRGHGAFEKAITGLNLLQKHDVEFRLAFCIMRHNIGDIPDMIGLAERVGAREIAFRKIKLLGRASEIKDEVYPSPEEMTRAYSLLYRAAYGREPEKPRINAKYNDVILRGRGAEYNRLPCGAGRNIIHVTYRGDLVPCSLFTEERFVLGNVREDRIAEVWRNSDLLSFFRDTRVEDVPGCKGCTFRHLCGGGCRAEAYFLEGDLLGRCCDCEDLLMFYDYLFSVSAGSAKKVTV